MRNQDDSWRLTLAISGVHTLGSAKQENSGYEGAWSSRENMGIFNNQYFRNIIAKGWAPELNIGGNPDKNAWKRIDAGVDPNHKEMMLNTDLCFVYEDNKLFGDCAIESGTADAAKCRIHERKGTYLNAAKLDKTREECCAWDVKDNLPWISKGNTPCIRTLVDDKYLQEKETNYCGRTMPSEEKVRFGKT